MIIAVIIEKAFTYIYLYLSETRKLSARERETITDSHAYIFYNADEERPEAKHFFIIMVRKLFLFASFAIGLALTSCNNDKGGADMPNGKINGHEYVNLGLPSNLKWATQNVDATSPGHFGGYYAWGETETKSYYDEKTCFTWNEPMDDITWDGTFDVAKDKWGSTWRMPTREEFQELVKECKWKWTTWMGCPGFEVEGPNGNSIFLPAGGMKVNDWVMMDGVEDENNKPNGFYWSSTPVGDNKEAFGLEFHQRDNHYGVEKYPRYYGFLIRPVSF